MRIILWHGYLLTGSGSNVYTANIARAWRTAGHDVLVMCQDRGSERLDFVDATGSFDATNGSFSTHATGVSPASGSCVVVCPAIGKILPVYVLDDYEGFTAKLFVDLSERELIEYTESNVTALGTAIESFEPDAIVTGHEVMGPAIARRVCEPRGRDYIVKLHGSALEFAVKRQQRYRDEAAYGLNGAAAVAGGSRYMIRAASAVVPGWAERAAVVNPGCDVELFRPAPARAKGPPRVGFVGKLITNKGAHDLIAAVSLLGPRPLRLSIVGDGSFRAELERIAAALVDGDVTGVVDMARADTSGHLAALEKWARGRDGADVRASYEGVGIEFFGHLEHDPLAGVLPGFDVLVVPSIVPEAFGMVAAEGAACGVLPVVPDHSGIAEAGAAIEEAIERPGLLTYDSTRPVEGIAESVGAVLDLDDAERRRLGQAASGLARGRWSWDRVAVKLLELAPRR